MLSSGENGLFNEVSLLFICKRNESWALKQAIEAVESWARENNTPAEVILKIGHDCNNDMNDSI